MSINFREKLENWKKDKLRLLLTLLQLLRVLRPPKMSRRRLKSSTKKPWSKRKRLATRSIYHMEKSVDSLKTLLTTLNSLI
jgi:hypothetical protein